MFKRDFIDYHKDRFEDHSLLVFKDKTLVSVLPANVFEETIHSHQGLTYGGLVIHRSLKLEETIGVFKAVLIFLNDQGIRRMDLKVIPAIYNDLPSDEIDYIMFLLDAQLTRRDTLCTVDLHANIQLSSSRQEGYKRAIRNGLSIKEEDRSDQFWQKILIPNLRLKYKVDPVHSLNEIMWLKERFPKHIRQFNVYQNDELVAGTTIFETKNVAHAQYISGNDESSKLGSLDFLYVHLIKEVFKNKRYLDFGISNENNGRNVNAGLQFWKEGFGTQTVMQNFYRVETKDHDKLNTIML